MSDLQQTINWLCEKLSIGGWKPGTRCLGLTWNRAVESDGREGDEVNVAWRCATCGFVTHLARRNPEPVQINEYLKPHDIPAPDLLKPEGHLMLEKALWERHLEIEIHRVWLSIYPPDQYCYQREIIDGALSIALVLAAYDALHKEK